jgi:hypothetical protein
VVQNILTPRVDWQVALGVLQEFPAKFWAGQVNGHAARLKYEDRFFRTQSKALLHFVRDSKSHEEQS